MLCSDTSGSENTTICSLVLPSEHRPHIAHSPQPKSCSDPPRNMRQSPKGICCFSTTREIHDRAEAVGSASSSRLLLYEGHRNSKAQWTGRWFLNPRKGDHRERRTFFQQLTEVSPNRCGTRPHDDARASRRRHRLRSYPFRRSCNCRLLIDQSLPTSL